jgi:hypothetical protein
MTRHRIDRLLARTDISNESLFRNEWGWEGAARKGWQMLRMFMGGDSLKRG